MMMAGLVFYGLAGLTLLSAMAVVFARSPVYAVLFLILSFFTSAGIFLLLDAEFLAMVLVIVYVGAVAVLFLFVVMMLDVDQKHLEKLRHYPWKSFFKAALRSGVLAGVFLGVFYMAKQLWGDKVVFLSDEGPLTHSFILAAMSFAVAYALYWPLSKWRFLLPSESAETVAWVEGALQFLIFAGVMTYVLFGAPSLEIKKEVFDAGGAPLSTTDALSHLLYSVYVIPFQGVGVILVVAIVAAIALCLRHRPGVRRQDVQHQLKTTKEDVLSLSQPKVGKGVEWTSR